ncbi:CIC11C00000003653 [Sungouiella intermedia]|uniref:ER membrane protein complex subunit 6 n=1 Tax=Sungouiella intermedia TaxID=45354 RepID=A0A1L0DXD8_9ASCO|nr:CIC11C00000003653 [[Candida] intermedia]
MDPLYFPPNILANKQKLQRLQDVMSLALGVGAGVLCLESLNGFFFFLVTFSLSNLSFFLLCCEGKPESFFQNPWKEIFLDGISSSLAGYVMMWCLTYALVK